MSDDFEVLHPLPKRREPAIDDILMPCPEPKQSQGSTTSKNLSNNMINSGCHSSKKLSKKFPTVSLNEIKSNSALTLANRSASASTLFKKDSRRSTKLTNNSDASLSVKPGRKSLRSVADLKLSKGASSSRKKCLERARVLKDVDKKSHAVNTANDIMSRISSEAKQKITFDELTDDSIFLRRSSIFANSSLPGDKMFFNDSDLRRMGSQVNKDTFTLLSYEFPDLKSISKCDGQKVTKIGFKKGRSHFGYPYNGLDIYPPRFVSDYKIVTSPISGDKLMVPNYITGVFTWNGKDRNHAKIRCESLKELVTKVRQLKDYPDDYSDDYCAIYGGHVWTLEAMMENLPGN